MKAVLSWNSLTATRTVALRVAIRFPGMHNTEGCGDGNLEWTVGQARAGKPIMGSGPKNGGLGEGARGEHKEARLAEEEVHTRWPRQTLGGGKEEAPPTHLRAGPAATGSRWRG